MYKTFHLQHNSGDSRTVWANWKSFGQSFLQSHLPTSSSSCNFHLIRKRVANTVSSCVANSTCQSWGTDHHVSKSRDSRTLVLSNDHGNKQDGFPTIPEERAKPFVGSKLQLPTGFEKYSTVEKAKGTTTANSNTSICAVRSWSKLWRCRQLPSPTALLTSYHIREWSTWRWHGRMRWS